MTAQHRPHMPNNAIESGLMIRFCRLLLRMYPADHRRAYGGMIEQLFRDQWRDACRERGAAGRAVAGLHLCGDLLSSSLHEHISNLTNPMKTTGLNPLSHLLLAAAIGAALLANPGLIGHGPAVICVALSTLALIARAVVEWLRPPGESLKAIAWGVGILVAYGLIMPVWAKAHLINDSASPIVPFLLGAPVFLNTLVPLLKAILDRRSRTT
jgi:hypothetical protein